MGSALYVSIKNPPADLDTMMNGKALASAWDSLDAAAQHIGVPPLNKLCNPAWKAPEKGLPVFNKYLEYVRAHRQEIPDAPDLIQDLEDVIRLIGEAQRLNSKWRLMLDY